MHDTTPIASFSRLRLARMAAAFAVAICCAGAGSIFDDDWKPPPRSIAVPVTQPVEGPTKVPTPIAPPAPATTPTNPAPSTAPATAPINPPVIVPAPATDARLGIPPKADLTKSRLLMKELYAKELADHSAAAREQLTKKLLDQAQQANVPPADEYVLSSGAYESALEAGDLRLCFRAIEVMTKNFMLDAAALKEHAVLKLSAKAFATHRNANVQAAMEVLDALDTAEDYAAAERVGVTLHQAAASDATLRSSVQKHLKPIEERRIAYERYARELEKLKTSPSDPAANLAVGQYLCFTKSQWDRGLPLLAKGSDVAMKAAAEKDLAMGATGASANNKADAAAALADEWWTLSEKEASASIKNKLLGRSAYWYRQALSGLSGLSKLRAERRIAQVPPELIPSDVRIVNTANAPEAEKIIGELTSRFPEAMKDAKTVELVKYHDGSELRGGNPKAVADAYSGPTPAVGSGGGITFWGVYEDWPAGQYVIAYRVQELSEVKADHACFLDVCRGGGTIAGLRPAGAEFTLGKWAVFPLPLKLDNTTKIEFRLWPQGHPIALDRIYVFRLE